MSMSSKSPQANYLVTSWTMERLNQKNEAIQQIDQLIQKYPDNKILELIKAKFQDQPTEALPVIEKNATIRILDQLSELP